MFNDCICIFMGMFMYVRVCSCILTHYQRISSYFNVLLLSHEFLIHLDRGTTTPEDLHPSHPSNPSPNGPSHTQEHTTSFGQIPRLDLLIIKCNPNSSKLIKLHVLNAVNMVWLMYDFNAFELVYYVNVLVSCIMPSFCSTNALCTCFLN